MSYTINVVSANKDHYHYFKTFFKYKEVIFESLYPSTLPVTVLKETS